MDINRATYFKIAADHKPGKLASITATLMEENVSMHGLWGHGLSKTEAQVIAIPHDKKKFKSVAEKAEWVLHEGVCFHIEGQDKTGALVDLLQKIAEEGINLMALDSISMDGHFGCYIWAEDEDSETLAQLLGLSVPLA